MNYKIKGAIQKNRDHFIIYIIIWVVIALLLIPPFTYSNYVARLQGTFDLSQFIETFGSSMTNPFDTVINIFKNKIFGNYFSNLLFVTVIYTVFFFISFLKVAPKNEYTDIEHGSSDWSQHGEQYRILNRKEGIILARDNYLPVTKKGNINVLVVGRIRSW